jgi:2-C-methyl-D-erythritol 2,4-cyclodiphosphate synthase
MIAPGRTEPPERRGAGLIRIGFGYDIHRLVEGRSLWIGCVQIAHDKGLLGHSDGDVVAHALCDAALGAAGLGDLGMQFPPGNPEWKDAPGRRLIEETKRRMEEQGARLVQADLTVLAEAPRLSPHRDAMIAAVAQAWGCSARDLSIKARTNEGLGEIGRGEAIAAYAVVLVEQDRSASG